MPPRRSRPHKPKTGSPNWAAATVHLVLVIGFGLVWAWHLTEQANKQEVAKKQGWFLQYYTFAGFTLQLVQFIVALTADIEAKGFVVRLADDISCATLPIASFITAFYYVLLLSGNIVDSDDVPAWVSPALHTGNFTGLLADLLVSGKQRTFRSSASLLSAAVNLAYMAFCYRCRVLNGSYPYRFLDNAPEPYGIVASAVVLVVGVEAIFLAARQLKRAGLLG